MYRNGIILITGLLLIASGLSAQGNPELKLEISEQKVNLKPAEAAGSQEIIYSPGDTIHYTIIAQNVGDGIMSEPVIVDPVPQGVSYLAGSAYGVDSEIFYSINDGSSYMNWPVTYPVQDENGKIVQKEATAAMVTHIKWQLIQPLAPGASRELGFQVLVN